MVDPFAGLGKALLCLRERAGFSTQTEAAKILRVDKGQVSRWEHEKPRPTLENLGRVLAGYGATVFDLAAALGSVSAKERLPSLAEAVRRIEESQVEINRRIERLENELRRTTSE